MTAVNQNLTLLAGKTFYVCPTVGTHQVIVGHQKRETKRVGTENETDGNFLTLNASTITSLKEQICSLPHDVHQRRLDFKSPRGWPLY